MNHTEIQREMRQVPQGSVVLIHDAGMVAFGNPHASLVDVVGLKTPSSVAYHRKYTRGACSWDRALGEIAEASGARFAIVLQDPKFWSCVATNLQRNGWNLRLLPSRGDYQLFAISRK